MLLGFIALSNTWTLCLYLSVPKEHFFRYFNHELTYSVVHGSVFSLAAAVLFTTVDSTFFVWFAKLSRPLRIFLGALAVFFMILTTIAVISDNHTDYVASHMLGEEAKVRPPDGQPKPEMTVWDYNEELHRRFDKLPKKPSEDLTKSDKQEQQDFANKAGKYAAYKEYENYLRSYIEIVKPVEGIKVINGVETPMKRTPAELGMLNSVFYVSLLLTWVFATLITSLYVPALITTGCFKKPLRRENMRLRRIRDALNDPSLDEDQRTSYTCEFKGGFATYKKDRLYYRTLWTNHLVFLMLVVCWFPFRCYATYYGKCIFMEPDFSFITTYIAFFTLLFLAAVFFSVLMLMRWGRSLFVALASIQGGLAAIAGIVMVFNADVRAFAYAVVENGLRSSYIYAFIFYCGLFILGALLAFFATEDPLDELEELDEPPKPTPFAPAGA